VHEAVSTLTVSFLENGGAIRSYSISFTKQRAIITPSMNVVFMDTSSTTP
jgi:hypothetical protein